MTRFGSLVKHLGRARAQRSWTIIFGAVLVDHLADPPVIHETTLVLVGVLLTFILLPDPAVVVEETVTAAVVKASPWIVDPILFARVMSPTAVDEAIARLLEAASEGRGNPCHEYLVRPFLNASPQDVLLDHSYMVNVEKIDYEHEPSYRVTTTSVARRILARKPWVGFALTEGEFGKEYLEDACLGRYLVDVSPRLWEKLLSNDKQIPLGASIEVDGGKPIKGKRTMASRELIRCYFNGVRYKPTSLRSVKVVDTFVIPGRRKDFHVNMGSYYCLGKTSIIFSITDPEVFNVRLMPALGGVAESAPEKGVQRWADGTGIKVETEPTLLTPGSGIVFAWDRDPAEGFRYV